MGAPNSQFKHSLKKHMTNYYITALAILIGLIFMIYRCVVDPSPKKRIIYLIGIGFVFFLIVEESIMGAKMNLGIKYLETCLNPSAQILTSVKADIEEGEMLAAQEKIDMLISHLGTHNHYWYDMPQINTLADEIEANQTIEP